MGQGAREQQAMLRMANISALLTIGCILRRKVKTVDKLMLIVVSAGFGFGLGIIVSEEKSAVDLKPCPKQAGFHNTSSTWTKETGLRCNYMPVIKKI